ncbi:hypothetical protein ESCO_003598 [Escovopsis weberi]|uniref:Uncharacterized protein n=1 Tax=Escovopsis weberi TaxID=150374 RepID=A0A0M8N8G7_ESCWE|nr:hypothetical protein ESCO_003598 [Escovopsis weberi]
MSAQRWNPASEPQTFDAAQRDRQARGKDPYARSEDEASDDSDSSAGEKKPLRLGQGIALDSFQDREKRAFALSVLDSPEQLTMYAQSTNDSIPSQRHRFTAMLCGYAPELKPIPQRARSSLGTAPTTAPAAARDAREARHAQRPGAGPSGQ